MSNRSWDSSLTRILARIDQTATEVQNGFPHYADANTGQWTTSTAGDWTGGFWNGMLWQAYAATNDPRYRELARAYTERLRNRIESETIFRGFLFYYGAAIGSILCDDESAAILALQGARALASQFNQKAQLIPLGAEAEEASSVGRGEANIDGVPGGTPLLVWAARTSGDQDLADIGCSHALSHIDLCVRHDGSVSQSASFDSITGKTLRRYTHKGYADDSTWTRAQAWAMLGYSTSAAAAPDQVEFLATAQRTADWWIANVPSGLIAFWDFDAPDLPHTPKDTSGTAIAAASLLKLAELLGDTPKGKQYRMHAEATVEALVRDHLTPIHAHDDRPPGILTNGCYNNRIGLAVDNELIWGDYFLMESLLVLGGQLKAISC